VFTAHSGFVQWQRASGRHWLNRTEATREEVLSGAHAERIFSPSHHLAAARSLRHFSQADRWGLVDLVEIKLGLAWGKLLQDETESAEADIRAAVALAVDQPRLHENLIDLLVGRGRFASAALALEDKLANVEPTAEDQFKLANLLVESGRVDEAVAQYERAVEAAPEAFEARYNFGGVLRRLERHAEAIEQLEAAAGLRPDDPDTQVELGLAHMALGDNEAALTALRRAIELDPDSPESRMHLPNLIRQLE
jgi:tetratricopeptide (TPR) repeat protein